MDQTFHSNGLGQKSCPILFNAVGLCEADVEITGARVQLRNFDWVGKSHLGSFATSARFVELTDVRATGGYHPSELHWQSLGAMRFYPGHRSFYSRWFEDRQTSLLCTLDVERLTGLEFEIDDSRLMECCDVRNDYLRALLGRIQQELRAPGFARDLVLETACVAAAIELIRNFSKPDALGPAGRDTISGDLLQRLAAEIRDGGAVPSLDGLAQAEGISTRHFARLFRAMAGESLGQFCARNLVLRSKDLLADRRLAVKEIAYRCGFAGTASFSRAFRRETGCSPQAYRSRRY